MSAYVAATEPPIFAVGALLFERATGMTYAIVERSDDTGTMFVEPQVAAGTEPWAEQWYLSQAAGMIARGALVVMGEPLWTF